jgi:hypothetical protein
MVQTLHFSSFKFIASIAHKLFFSTSTNSAQIISLKSLEFFV